MYENVEHFSFVSKKKNCLFVSRQERYGFLSKYLEFRFVLSQKFSTSNSRRQNIYSVAVSKHYSPTCLDGIQSI